MATCSQLSQREPGTVPDFQHREPSGYVRGFTAHDRLHTQGYPQQYIGYSGQTPHSFTIMMTKLRDLACPSPHQEEGNHSC